MSAGDERTPEERLRLRRAHERLRTASTELQALVATEPIKGRWAPETAPPAILAAARVALEQAWEGVVVAGAPVLGTPPGEPDRLEVVERGRPLSFGFADLMAYHGPGSPGGVAHAFKVLQRALPLVATDGPPERRELVVTTAFGGPGARDGFELVTRAVSDGRHTVDPALARPELGATRERFVFRVTYRGRSATLVLRDGFVTEEFVALLGEERDAEQEARLTVLKGELADRLTARSAPEVYDVTVDQEADASTSMIAGKRPPSHPTEENP